MRPKLEETVRLQRPLGVRAEILEPVISPAVEQRIDPEHLGAVLYEPDSGYGDPTAVTLGYAEAARRGGVRIEQGVEVVVVRTTGGRVTGVETSAGERIDAPVVVNAAGLWSKAVGSWPASRCRSSSAVTPSSWSSATPPSDRRTWSTSTSRAAATRGPRAAASR
jgi:4-methylaminobutanoate oxidase (formaldehyde-forming)